MSDPPSHACAPPRAPPRSTRLPPCLVCMFRCLAVVVLHESGLDHRPLEKGHTALTGAHVPRCRWRCPPPPREMYWKGRGTCPPPPPSSRAPSPCPATVPLNAKCQPQWRNRQ